MQNNSRALFIYNTMSCCTISRCLFVSACLVAASGNARNFSVFAYLPEWRLAGANFDALSALASDIAFFSVEPAADGSLAGADRLPAGEALASARASAAAHGASLLICAGGNGRSAHFSAVVRSPRKRARFVASLVRAVQERGFHGVDLNWEYPGYSFSGGYQPPPEVKADYAGLARLARDLRAALPAGARLTLAYYPDGRQEAELRASGAWKHVDLMHAMAYDAAGGAGGHSSVALAEAALAGGAASGLPVGKLTLGVPFYGRHSATGDWTTYEDVVQRHAPLAASADAVPAPAGRSAGTIHFNGPDTIALKTRLALQAGCGGVMIWEGGQDCRLAPVTRDGRTHARTCPGAAGGNASLLVAIARTLLAADAGGGRGRDWLRALDGGDAAPPREEL